MARRTPSVASESAALDRLRGHRVRADRARGLGADLEVFMKGVRRVSLQCERAAVAWGELVPGDVSAGTRVVDLKAGALVVQARSASDRHRADRWLRSGGLAALRERAGAPIRRVRFDLVATGWDR